MLAHDGRREDLLAMLLREARGVCDAVRLEEAVDLRDERRGEERVDGFVAEDEHGRAREVGVAHGCGVVRGGLKSETESSVCCALAGVVDVQTVRYTSHRVPIPDTNQTSWL